MKNPKLPPDIEGIREAIRYLQHDDFGCGSDKCPHWQKDCFNDDWVIDNGLCSEMIDQLLSKLTEHGVVMLKRPIRHIDASRKEKFFEVVNLDGTPVKEG